MKQNIELGEYFTTKSGEARTIPEVRYPFTVTIHPCEVTGLETYEAPADMIYVLGEEEQS